MIYLHQIANDDFSLFHADQMATEAIGAVYRLKPASVVVRHWGEGSAYYYLYAAQEFLDVLAQADGEQTLVDALQLQAEAATPDVDAYADAEAAPPRCVVTDGDRVIGIYDVTQPPTVSDRRRSDAESVTIETGPVTRLLQADFPEYVSLGQTVSLLVWLTQQMRDQSGLPMAVPLGSQLDIVVQVRQGFALEGPGESQLTVTEEEETLPIQFKLRATGLGPGRIRVFCFQAGQSLGSITLAPTVIAADQPAAEQRSSVDQRLAPLSLVQPDLTLIIFENTSQGRPPEIIFRLWAVDPQLNLNLKSFGPVRLRLEPLQYFKDFFEDIEGLPIEAGESQRKMALKGARLFKDLLPENLRVLLWALRDRITTVQVLSDEPWIPWELLKLQGQDDDGRVTEGPFLCEAFVMTRWFPEIGRRPGLGLKRIGVICPADSGLPYAQDERDYLFSLAGHQRQVEQIPATFLTVEETLSRGEYDGWHFTGHGKFESPDPDRSRILLEQKRWLSPGEISGRVSNCGLRQPLVFLNACQTGQQALSLTGMGGWAQRVIEVGAAAFIGPLWSVHDKAAYQFAQAFYHNLLAGKTIGQATRDARTAIQPHNDRLAYTVFADPLATVQ
ncbi:MAG: CHAT domain-containing protein [Anaerolineae bacterium]|nr:CHAT domain-containing protein [Anaerolineae bacterium]